LLVGKAELPLVIFEYKNPATLFTPLITEDREGREPLRDVGLLLIFGRLVTNGLDVELLLIVGRSESNGLDVGLLLIVGRLVANEFDVGLLLIVGRLVANGFFGFVDIILFNI